MTLRVLHVDDEPDIREVVALSLELDSQIVTRACACGADALAVAAEWKPDIILLDVMMPEMDGPATFAKLREDGSTADIPVVFMTARAHKREIDRFRGLGAAGVIPKPFSPATLAYSVRNFLSPAQMARRDMEMRFKDRLERDMRSLIGKEAELRHDAERAALKEFRAVAHGLAGAAGIFGFPDVSAAAAELDEAATALLEDRAPAEDIEAMLDALVEAAATVATAALVQIASERKSFRRAAQSQPQHVA